MHVLLISVLAVTLIMPGDTVAASGFSGQVRVIDGDTIDVGDVRVRLHGIDAPEMAQTCKTEQGVKWTCGRWVTEQVTALFAGNPARCERLGEDRYRRTVARCTVFGQDMSLGIVNAGLAFAYRKYTQDYAVAEEFAAARDIGLHASQVETPSQFRRTRAIGRIPPEPSCAIKGNISDTGVRIFHLPGQRDYERTTIHRKKGERWFCSTSQARYAGWRMARR